jgi:hypothetical protein
MSRMLVVAIAAAALSATSAGCSGKDPFNPGTKLGTFRVTAQLTRSTCGPTPNPWTFDVRLAHDGPTLYWVQGGAPVEGQIDHGARALLEVQTLHDLSAADPKRKKAACSVSRSDALAVTLAGPDAKPVADPAETSARLRLHADGGLRLLGPAHRIRRRLRGPPVRGPVRHHGHARAREQVTRRSDAPK